jgi:uncharacterized protein YjbI with pentapeptide repeats
MAKKKVKKAEEPIVTEAKEVEAAIEKIEKEKRDKPSDSNRVRLYFEKHRHLSDLILDGIEVCGLDFRTSKVNNSIFKDTKFINCNFQGCNFTGVESVEGCTFVNCDLRWTTNTPSDKLNKYEGTRV